MLKEGEIRQWQKEKGIGRKMKIERRETTTTKECYIKNDKSWPNDIKSQSRGCQKGKNALLCNLLFFDDSEKILLGPEHAN